MNGCIMLCMDLEYCGKIRRRDACVCFIHVVYLAKLQAQVECRPAKKSIEEGLMNEVGGNKGL